MIRRLAMLVLGLLCFWAPSPCRGSSGTAYGGDPAKEGRWQRPSPEIQRDMDPTLVPVGRGAVFVPCMSQPLLEPAYSVYCDGKLVETVPVGTRVIVEPGTCRVVLGAGAEGDRVERHVTVREGKTAIVKPDWAGLQVQVVDANTIPFRGAYELLALPDFVVYGVGMGAQVEQGEQVRTWILEPGLYMILRVGESYQARTNFFTFRVRPGVLEQIILVVDPDTGDFLGAGEQSAFTAGSQLTRDLTLSAVVGGCLSLTHQTNITGAADTTFLGPSFYLDLLARYSPARHFFYARLSSEEAFTQEDWGRFEKNVDFLRADVLYAYRLLEWMGPYARLGLETTVFPGYQYFDKPTTVTRSKDVGVSRVWSDVEEFKLSDPLYPMVVKGGTGLRFNTLPNPFIDLWTLLGVGGRMTYTDLMFVPDDDTHTLEFEVNRVADFRSLGAEATVVLRTSFSRWVIGNTEFEVFVPFDELSRPTMRWDNNVSLRLTSFISLNYIYRLKYEPEITTDFQQDHQALLRFSYKFF